MGWNPYNSPSPVPGQLPSLKFPPDNCPPPPRYNSDPPQTRCGLGSGCGIVAGGGSCPGGYCPKPIPNYISTVML